MHYNTRAEIDRLLSVHQSFVAVCFECTTGRRLANKPYDCFHLIRILNMFRVCLIVLGCATIVQADDWPQWMGPKRDNVWRESGLVETLPASPKNPMANTDRTGGYSGPAIAGGKVYVTDYVTKDDVKIDNFKRNESTGPERIVCLDEKTGPDLWTHQRPEKYAISYPAGPRSTPLIHEGKVYVQGAEGWLACLDANSDKLLIWEKSLKETCSKTKAALAMGLCQSAVNRRCQTDRARRR